MTAAPPPPPSPADPAAPFLVTGGRPWPARCASRGTSRCRTAPCILGAVADGASTVVRGCPTATTYVVAPAAALRAHGGPGGRAVVSPEGRSHAPPDPTPSTPATRAPPCGLLAGLVAGPGRGPPRLVRRRLAVGPAHGPGGPPPSAHGRRGGRVRGAMPAAAHRPGRGPVGDRLHHAGAERPGEVVRAAGRVGRRGGDGGARGGAHPAPHRGAAHPVRGGRHRGGGCGRLPRRAAPSRAPGTLRARRARRPLAGRILAGGGVRGARQRRDGAACTWGGAARLPGRAQAHGGGRRGGPRHRPRGPGRHRRRHGPVAPAARGHRRPRRRDHGLDEAPALAVAAACALATPCSGTWASCG